MVCSGFTNTSMLFSYITLRIDHPQDRLHLQVADRVRIGARILIGRRAFSARARSSSSSNFALATQLAQSFTRVVAALRADICSS